MKESLLTSILQRSKDNKEIISIWQYNGDKSSSVGYVTEISDEHLNLKHFTPYGKCDGNLFIKLAHIKTIDFNDDYTKVMECVIEYSNIFDQPSNFNLEISFSGNWQLDTLRKLSKLSEQVVSVEINGSEFFTGLVKQTTEEDFILNCIGKNGEDQGTALFRVEDVTEIKVNDLDSRRRLILYKWRKASL